MYKKVFHFKNNIGSVFKAAASVACRLTRPWCSGRCVGSVGTRVSSVSVVCQPTCWPMCGPARRWDRILHFYQNALGLQLK